MYASVDYPNKKVVLKSIFILQLFTMESKQKWWKNTGNGANMKDEWNEWWLSSELGAVSSPPFVLANWQATILVDRRYICWDDHFRLDGNLIPGGHVVNRRVIVMTA